MVSLTIVSSNNQDRTLEVLIDNVRYEYWFHGEVPLPTVRKIMKHSAGRTIAYLKKNSYKVEVLTPDGNDSKSQAPISNTQDQTTS